MPIQGIIIAGFTVCATLYVALHQFPKMQLHTRPPISFYFLLFFNSFGFSNAVILIDYLTRGLLLPPVRFACCLFLSCFYFLTVNNAAILGADKPDCFVLIPLILLFAISLPYLYRLMTM